MVDPERITRIAAEINNHRRTVDRADGVLSELLATAKKEFGCQNLDELEVILKKLREEEVQLCRKLDRRVEEYEQEFGKRVEMEDED